MTREQKIKAFTMKLDGKSYREIGEHFGVSKQYVQEALSVIVIPKKQIESIIYPNVKLQMYRLNLSVSKLEKELNVKRDWLRRQLVGQTTFTVQAAALLSDYFGISMEDVIKTE